MASKWAHFKSWRGLDGLLPQLYSQHTQEWRREGGEKKKKQEPSYLTVFMLAKWFVPQYFHKKWDHYSPVGTHLVGKVSLDRTWKSKQMNYSQPPIRSDHYFWCSKLWLGFSAQMSFVPWIAPATRNRMTHIYYTQVLYIGFHTHLLPLDLWLHVTVNR